MNTAKKFSWLLIFLILNNFASAQVMDEGNALRALIDNATKHHLEKSMTGDTIHVSSYVIYIDTVRFADSSIWGHTNLEVVSRMNSVNIISLSLLRMTIDSISSNSIPMTYYYNDTALIITSPDTLNTGDSIGMKIYYHGHPKEDASGWGGFYWSGTYAFNLGVGFDAIPHNYGRVWFPCIDEFTDKSLFEYYITTPPNDKDFSNGLLIGVVTNPDSTKTWHWKLDEPIPSYLACMNVAPFYTLQRTVAGFPVEWACLATDTNHTLSTFTHLSNALINDTASWGPYRWEKVGYTEIPFNSGAMEHATAISIGKVFVDGTLNYETLWAHELSHHWFGDLVTCKSAEEMYLNEGWAHFNEAFFTQAVYGDVAYKNWIRTNHHTALQFANYIDSGYWALFNVPQSCTYGTTVYDKGADIIRTIRSYMGDSAFFPAVKGYLNDLAFGNADSYNFRDELSMHSSINMNQFFNDWIFSPGFPHFSIDSVISVSDSGNFNVTVYTRQREHGNPNHIYKMPVDITFADETGDSIVASIVIDNLLNSFQFSLPFNPTWTALDRNEKIAQAVVSYEIPITASGNFTFSETNSSLIAANLGTGANRIRIEHNYCTPDGFKGSNHGIVVSNYHYYKVDGVFSPGFVGKVTFIYNGSNSTTSGFLDNNLITGIEDSLVLLYRSGTADDWHVVSDYVINYGGNHTDKIGSITVDTVLKGEYVFGYYNLLAAGVPEVQKNLLHSLNVFPNPNSGIVNISFHLNNGEQGIIKITDIKGKLIYSNVVNSSNDSLIYDASKNPSGNYFVSLEVKGKQIQTTKFILNHE